MCLRDLRDKVSNGVDPTKLQEDQVQQDSVDEQGSLFWLPSYRMLYFADMCSCVLIQIN